jgi:hypothetical protein
MFFPRFRPLRVGLGSQESFKIITWFRTVGSTMGAMDAAILPQKLLNA